MGNTDKDNLNENSSNALSKALSNSEKRIAFFKNGKLISMEL